jgi:hypothetical protein
MTRRTSLLSYQTLTRSNAIPLMLQVPHRYQIQHFYYHTGALLLLGAHVVMNTLNSEWLRFSGV